VGAVMSLGLAVAFRDGQQNPAMPVREQGRRSRARHFTLQFQHKFFGIRISIAQK